MNAEITEVKVHPLKGRTPWNAGTGKGWTDPRGYRWIYVIENGQRRAKREHRHVMEQYLGRVLGAEELVHHINGNRADNRIENLRLEAWGEHTADHHRGIERPEYIKRRLEVLANYREDNKRLKAVNADLLAALKLAARTPMVLPAPGTREAIHAAIKKATGS